LSKLINYTDAMSREEIAEFGIIAKKRVEDEYTWEKICGQYLVLFTEN